MIAAMLCHPGGTTLRDVPRDWIMEAKLDGWRFQIHVGDTVRGFAGRGGGTEYPVPAELAEALAHLPAGTVLDGELIVAGGASTDVPNRLASGSTEGLVYVAFDILKVMGFETMGKPWFERRELLEAALDHVPAEDRMLVQPVVTAEVDTAVFDHWMALGLEGVVCKDPESEYRPGKRSRSWVKVKPVETMDAIVYGWEYGAGGSNRHQCGKLKIRLLDTGVETSCKYDASPQDAERMLGRRIEVQHFGILKSGAVRHPTYVRTREDLL